MSPNRGTTHPAMPASRPMSRLVRLVGAMSAASMLILATASWAQETGGASGGATGADSNSGATGVDSNSKEPIEISADNGIEWKRDARTYTARGNAIAKQGDTTVAGDTLIAYLDAQDEVMRWEAMGNVKIENNQSTSYGDHAEYTEAKRLLVLTGKNLKTVTDNETVTARDEIEYWRDKEVVVAKGNVVIVQPKKNTTVHSDEATAFFRDKVDDPATPEDESGDQEVYQIEAQGNVRVDRNEQTAFSDHLAYDPNTDIALLTGNVVIHDKDNTYRGGRAELDMTKNISRLLPAAEGQRVITVIKPKENSSGSGNNAAPVTQ
jgi:lipopolysaccharide export system protein LptA